MSPANFTKIAVFYDGNYFSYVSNYYHFHHKRRQRISIGGLHRFIRNEVAQMDGADLRYCQIVDAHYFRGRLSAIEADERDVLLKERVFDEVLLREGITTHYLPLAPDGEKGIDVWMALEAFELALLKRFDVCVLVAGDGDFLPLVRKLNSLGTRVMVLGWDFKYLDQNGNERTTKTAQVLLDEASYPIMMQDRIDDRTKTSDPLINGLFVPAQEIKPRKPAANPTNTVSTSSATTRQQGRIQNLKEGFGFITPDFGGDNMFFYNQEVRNTPFSELKVGDKVEFSLGINDRGPCAVDIDVL